MMESQFYRFAFPEFLVAGGALLLLLGWWRWSGLFRRGSGHLRISSLGVAASIRPSGAVRLVRLVDLLRLVALGLMVVAFARPQAGERYEELLTEGIDIMIALDVSGSMAAVDFRPQTRLDVAKEVTAEFIRGRQTDRLGMVVYAGKSFTRCPLTLDYGVLLDFLDDVELGTVKEDGTAIGNALVTAINRLRDARGESRVIILLTDGINNAGQIDPLTAADMARAMEIKIYTIGAGKDGQPYFLVDDPIFGQRYVPGGEPLILDEETLGEVARRTGGLYFRAQDPESLSRIFARIGEMETTGVKTKEYSLFTELGPGFLLAALALLVLAALLSGTRFQVLP
jgi:Ca-activated chloride channel family protein